MLAQIADALNVSADYLIGRTNTAALKGKMKTVCELTGLSDEAAEYLAFLVKNKDRGKLSVINHLFKQLIEDYDYYNFETHGGEAVASNILGALFIYFDKCTRWDNIVEDFLDVGDDERRNVLSAAYRQDLLNQVTDAVKTDAEMYMEYNRPWE